jgi:hypothetical protein
MAYTLQQNAPQIVANGRTFALGAFQFDSMISLYIVAVFELLADGWSEVGKFALNTDPESILAAIVAAGGITKFNAQIDAQLAASVAAIFSTMPTPIPTTVAEPTTTAQAEAAISLNVNALKLTFVNGQLGITTS